MTSSPVSSERSKGAVSYRLRVSSYDRTASLILSLLLLVGMLVVGLVIVYVTMQLIERTVAVPIALSDASGRPADAAMGLAREIEPPGIEEAPELSEPDLTKTLSTLAKVASESNAILDEMAMDSDSEAGRGAGRGDSRKAGTGGDGNEEKVPRWERWQIRFVDVESLEEYAAQLDFFRIELAALANDGKVYYAFDFSSTPPKTRVGVPEEENRIRFLWKGGPLRRSDEALLRRAGVDYPGRPILQFIPHEVEATLLQLELSHAGNRDVNEIRSTVFAVGKKNNRFEFEVIEQRYF